MEKYGVLHEYKCECGYHVVLSNNQFNINPEHIKEAGLYQPGHLHKLVQIPDEVEDGPETVR